MQVSKDMPVEELVELLDRSEPVFSTARLGGLAGQPRSPPPPRTLLSAVAPSLSRDLPRPGKRDLRGRCRAFHERLCMRPHAASSGLSFAGTILASRR